MRITANNANQPAGQRRWSLAGARPSPKLLLALVLLLAFFACIALIQVGDFAPTVCAPLVPTSNTDVSKSGETTLPTVLCLILTAATNGSQEKVSQVLATWARRCDDYLILSNVTNSDKFINVTEKVGHAYLLAKVRLGMIHAYEKFNTTYDWVLKADDDTYVIVENLKRFVSAHSPDELVAFGCRFQVGHQGAVYASGGAGYVVSRAAFAGLYRTFASGERNESSGCRWWGQWETASEDVVVGECIQAIGGRMGDSRDARGRHRFMPFQAGMHFDKPPDWFSQYAVDEWSYSPACCADDPISFHYVPPKEMLLMDYFMYRTRLRTKMLK